MSTTPHPIAPEEIMAHLDGELSAARAQSVSTHVESCAACQELAGSLHKTSQSLSNWTVSAVPVNAKFEGRLSESAFNVSTKLSGSSGSKLRLVLGQRWKMLAAASASVVLLIMLVGLGAGRYEMSTPRAKHLAAMHAEEQEAIVARLSEEKGLASVDKLVTDENGLASPTDRFTRAEMPKQPSQGATKEFNRLESYARVQRPIDAQTAAPMIARRVSLSIVAKDFDSARASLDAMLARHSGYAANLNVATPQGAARMLQASLRIPAPQLPAVLAEFKSLGRVEGETQSGEEVTQQHADLVARLKNSRETEQRLQAILTQRTGKISDVLEVEQEIARVRGEIEQMEAEQKNLEHRVDFATIDLKLSEEYKARLDSPAPAISTLIHNAAVNGYRNAADTLLSIVLFFAEFGPVLIFWLFVFFIPGWLVWRRWRHATATI
jgi:hypothetical protein